MAMELPRNLVSRRSYGKAVAMAAVFGTLGVHHFYLGRHALGILDLALSAGAVYFLVASDDVPGLSLGIALLAVDGLHSLIETFRLIVGSYRDGDGAVVAYPGQVVTRRD
jgi:TM2 domain-containing membrane protein YozV